MPNVKLLRSFNAATADLPLTADALMFGRMIAHFADAEMKSMQGTILQLQRLTGMSDRGVQIARAELEKANLLGVLRRKVSTHMNLPNRYVLLADGHTTEQEDDVATTRRLVYLSAKAGAVVSQLADPSHSIDHGPFNCTARLLCCVLYSLSTVLRADLTLERADEVIATHSRISERSARNALLAMRSLGLIERREKREIRLLAEPDLLQTKSSFVAAHSPIDVLTLATGSSLAATSLTGEQAAEIKAANDEWSAENVASHSPKGLKEKSKEKDTCGDRFIELDFPLKLAYLWNAICVPAGAVPQSRLDGFEVENIADRCETARTKIFGIRQTITTLEDWAGFFHWLTQSRFLMGHVPGTNGFPSFRISMPWLFAKEATLMKVRSGAYFDNGLLTVEPFVMPEITSVDLEGFRPFAANRVGASSKIKLWIRNPNNAKANLRAKGLK